MYKSAFYMMSWRKSLADEAGLDFSGSLTWEDYVERGKKLTLDKDGDGTTSTFFYGSNLGQRLKNWICPEFEGDWRGSVPPGDSYAVLDRYGLIIPGYVGMEHKMKTWEVMKYLATDPEVQLRNYKDFGIFPAL